MQVALGILYAARAGMCKQISLLESQLVSPLKQVHIVGSNMMFKQSVLKHSIPYMHTLAMTGTNAISTRCLDVVTTSNIPCSTTLLLTKRLLTKIRREDFEHCML